MQVADWEDAVHLQSVNTILMDKVIGGIKSILGFDDSRAVAVAVERANEVGCPAHASSSAQSFFHLNALSYHLHR